MIYLDNASTTPIFDELLDVIKDTADVGNASSRHAVGKAAKIIIEDSRAEIAEILGAKPKEIYFTSSGTESNNTALFGVKNDKSKRTVISASEHSSVYYAAKRLQNLGYKVDFAPVDSRGKLDMTKFEKLLGSDVCLVSVMHVNNETGAVNDVKAISELVRNHSPNAVFHSDGVQAAGKFSVNLHKLGVDCYSISAHKFRGLKGVGALYVKDGVRLAPLIYGGGQERGMRSATENVPGIACMAKALKMYSDGYDGERLKTLAKRLTGDINSIAPDALIMSDADENPNIISVAFKDARGEVLQTVMSDYGVMIATGSACSSNKSSDRIAIALRIPKAYASGAVRFSLSARNTEEEIDAALSALDKALKFFK